MRRLEEHQRRNGIDIEMFLHLLCVCFQSCGPIVADSGIGNDGIEAGDSMDGLELRCGFVDVSLRRAVYFHKKELAAAALRYGIQRPGALVGGVADSSYDGNVCALKVSLCDGASNAYIVPISMK